MRPRGLTFIELIIAATMTSILFLGLGAHLQGGVRLWARTTEDTETLQQQRVALDRLERDLANAFIFETSPQVQPRAQWGSSSAAWFTVGAGGVRLVTYACEQREAGTGLWRRSQSIGQIRAGSEPAAAELVLPDCAALTMEFAYLSDTAGELRWDAQWKEPDDHRELPHLVKVGMRLKAVEASESEAREISRVCAIPAGILKPFPTEPEGG